MAGTKNSRKDHRGRVLPPNVSQKSDLRYIWRKMIDGRQYTITDNDLNELKKKIVQREADLQNGIYTDTHRVTLDEWFRKWIEVYKGNLKVKSKANYMETWNRHIRPDRISGMQLGKIKRIHIVELYKKLSEEVKLSTSTIHIIHCVLYGCFADAAEDGIIHLNPCDNAFKKVKRTEPQKREALTIGQQQAFMNFIANNDTYKVYMPLFTFLLGTGCRIGEATGLTWNDIDFRKNVITIDHTMGYTKVDGKTKFYIDTPKTKAGTRRIPIMPQVKKQLLRQRELDLLLGASTAKIDGYKNFVFHTSKGNPYIANGVNAIVKRIVKAYNTAEEGAAKQERREPLPLPDISPHIFRHTFCTRFCENESNIKVIQEIMGHQDIETTLGIYTHVTEEKASEAIQELSRKIDI